MPTDLAARIDRMEIDIARLQDDLRTLEMRIKDAQAPAETYTTRMDP